MEPINEQLNQIKKKMPSFEARFEEMRRETVEHPKVQQFLLEHNQQLTKQMIDISLPKLYEYISQDTECCGCGDTRNCTNLLKGHVPKLYTTYNAIDTTYVPCAQKLREDERRDVANMISSMYMPKDVLKATLKDLAIDNHSRLSIADQAAEFVAEFSRTGVLPKKGFYLYGPFGIGKSFVLGAIANELASLKVRSVVVFVPEFLREMKNAISDNTLNGKIDFVKKAPVLMLDDIGAETMSAWTRDEIIGTILHYRMSEELPTFITSNFDYAGLEHHLAQSQRGDIEVVKAARVMERIKAVTTPIQMDGINRRL
ncbi:MAG: primosomal protein DnaI [Solibacillus sp.]